jgi:Domain of unknown function (DUF1825)
VRARSSSSNGWKLTVEQLRTQLGQFGITPEQMFQQMQQTLERMKQQLETAG